MAGGMEGIERKVSQISQVEASTQNFFFRKVRVSGGGTLEGAGVGSAGGEGAAGGGGGVREFGGGVLADGDEGIKRLARVLATEALRVHGDNTRALREAQCRSRNHAVHHGRLQHPHCFCDRAEHPRSHRR